MPPRVRAVTQRHVLGFRCVGSDCPENCCGAGWRIGLDEGHYRRLKRALGDEEFARLAAPAPPEQRRLGNFGLLVLDEQGRCGQLDERGLCRIHARFGPDLLGDTCALYPRVPSLIDDRRELSLLVSCPEVARGPIPVEGATDLVEMPPALFPGQRKSGLRQIATRSAEPYLARLDDVRGAGYELLSDGGWPVASRIAFTLALAERLGEFFHPRSTTYSDERFDETVASVQSEAAKETIHRRLQGAGAAVEANLAPHFVLEMLAARLAVPGQPTFVKVALAALEGCASPTGRRRVEVAGARGYPPATMTASVELVASVHAGRWARLGPALRERLEVYFENYARSYWFRDCYLDALSLVAFAQALALRVAVLRFLLLGQSGTARAVEERDEQRAIGLLDEAMVECAWSFARAMEHNDTLFASLMRTLEEAGLHSLRAGLALLRF